MVNENTSTDTDNADGGQRGRRNPKQIGPSLLVAFCPEGAVTVDRCLIETPFTVGRKADNSLPIQDSTISKHHFRIIKKAGRYWLEDTGSRNGTFVNGEMITKQDKKGVDLSSRPLSVIRSGQAIVVFQLNTGLTLESPIKRYGMVGTFHLKSLIDQLETASISSRHILIVGPSGCGKELAAGAFAKLNNKNPGAPFIIHNAAEFSSAEEATTTLLGVASKTFSNVSPRPGLIEQAEGGTLFLDEIHSLPERVQKSLLRVIEDGRLTRIGETHDSTRHANSRFVFASNGAAPTYGLVKDLLARLRVIRVQPLLERVADIPEIFDHLLCKAMKHLNINESVVMCHLGADHYESLCLDGFVDDNVRGLLDLTDRIATSVANGLPPSEAINRTFDERFYEDIVTLRTASKKTVPISFAPDTTQSGEIEGTESVSHYETHRELIIETYLECKGNLSATERKLKEKRISASRTWLKVYVDKWRLPSKNELKIK